MRSSWYDSSEKVSIAQENISLILLTLTMTSNIFHSRDMGYTILLENPFK